MMEISKVASKLGLLFLSAVLCISCARGYQVCSPSSLMTAGYNYTSWFPLQSTGSGKPGANLEFAVTAASDATIYLYDAFHALSYVVIIDDTTTAGFSTIRRQGVTTTPVAESDNTGYLASPGQSFWIRMEENLLYVGIQGQVEPIVWYQDNEPLSISQVEFSYRGASGAAMWNYCYIKPSTCYSVTTAPFNVSYPFIVNTFLGTEVQVDFSVRTAADARIFLSPFAHAINATTPGYEIWLASAEDEITRIRREFGGAPVYEQEIPNLLSAEEYRSFFIRVFDGTIVIGNLQDPNLPLLTWTDPDPMTIYFASFSSGPGTAANWLC